MKLALYGYGNLARGVEWAATVADDTELIGAFTRRDPHTVHTVTGIPVYAADRVAEFADQIDVLVLCGGSASDLPHMTPHLARQFNVIDSFDTHARIPEHFAAVDGAARDGDRLALISAGWDPGLFSLARAYGQAVLPCGDEYTFWGRGVSQGHSDAVRRIDGVVDARQYTVPVPAAVEAVRSGETPTLTTRQKHTREVYVVAADGADRDRIAEEIRTMPNYFDQYDTTVTFITAEEMAEKHSTLPHGGSVFRSGSTGKNGEHRQVIEYHLQLDSNSEFTGSVLLAYARAVDRMYRRGERGCRTVLDVAPADLSPLSPEQLRSTLL